MLSRGNFNDLQFEQQIIFQLEQLRVFASNEKSTHTLLRKFIVRSHNNFSAIVLPYLTSSIRSIVLAAFKTI